MKKNKVKTTLSLIIIMVLCLSVGAYAAYVLSATEVSYTKSDGTEVSVKEALDELYSSKSDTYTAPLAWMVSVGEYVAYDATNNYSYTSPVGSGPSHGNGYGSQTFTSSSDIKWRVLSTDKSTGEVVLISSSYIQTDAGSNFFMKGAIGYLYAEQELNEICKIYGYGIGADTSKEFTYETGATVEELDTGTITGSGARSINVDDINNITGYTPRDGSLFTNSIRYPTNTTTTGKSTSAVSRTYLNTAYTYAGSSYLTTTEDPYKMLFINSYWLGSRCVSSGGVYFSTRYVSHYDKSINVDYRDELVLSNSNGFSESYHCNGVRPVVYLKPNIQTNGLDSSGAWIIVDN